MTPTFRPACPADASAIVALVQSAYRGETSKQGWTTEADLLDGQRTDAAEVLEVISRPQSRMILALDAQGALLGCCQLELRADAIGYFGMFSVRPGLQGKGLGDALLAESERVAVTAGCTAMHMTVLVQRSELIAWYARRGYRRTGQLSPFPQDKRFGVPRQPDLAFELLTKALE